MSASAGTNTMTTTTETDNVTDELIELNGLRLHYRDWASSKPGAHNLIILHGTANTSRVWDHIARALSADYRVLVLDLRGHGESQWAPPNQYGLDTNVDDLEAFVAALGLEHFTLIGHSQGANAGFGYAGKRPPELARFVIVDLAAELPEAALSGVLAMLQGRDVFDSPYDAIARRLRAAPNTDPILVRHSTLHNLMRTSDGKWTWRWDRALRDPSKPFPPLRSAAEGWALVAKINVPTLLVRGELSDLLPREFATRMVSTIPDCRLVEIAGSGHSPHAERPAAFLEAVRTFLEPGQAATSRPASSRF